ncbi:MAG: hypothetical protein JXB35_06255 [Anaerolineae bacterium]|nr:hypothetical protein [Anaerolineae bacterium]
MKTKVVFLTLVLTLVLAVSVVPVGAEKAPDCVDLGSFSVCYLGMLEHRDGTSTWTYAVVSDATGSRAGLSQFSVGICPAVIDSAVPGDGQAYTTPAKYGEVVGREGIVYKVQLGNNVDTGIHGITFAGGLPNLGQKGANEVDIFQFTIPSEGIAPSLVDVGIKVGSMSFVDSLPGPKVLLRTDCPGDSEGSRNTINDKIALEGVEASPFGSLKRP